MAKSFSCLEDLPEKVKPLFLHSREEVVIPSRDFDLIKHPFPSTFKSNIAKEWCEIERSDSLFIAHAISFTSQRRLLEAYYFNTENLSAPQLILYASFTVLAVRQLISGSLINIQPTSKSTLMTRNGIGLLLKVPFSCIYTISPVDANVPLERKGSTQHQFRKEIYDLSYHYFQNFNPKELLKSTNNDNTTQSYNEIAFVPRTTNPAMSIRLEGIFIDSNNSNFGRQEERGDIEPSSFYFECMCEVAHLLDLPFINLKEVREKSKE